MFFMNSEEYIDIERSKESVTIRLGGIWSVESLGSIESLYKKVLPEIFDAKKIVLDLKRVESIDTSAMIFFITMRSELKKIADTRVINTPKEFCRMFRMVKRFYTPSYRPKSATFASLLEPILRIGKGAVSIYYDIVLFLAFIGRSAIAVFDTLKRPSSFRIKETAVNIYSTGVTAIPIVALSSFLVGIVIAFQSAVQLQKYGANIFIVDMIGISIPRELAPLITAIIVAGRSGSAYTAQIGVMKITEEIDAMKTMGFEIFRFVVLPRMAAMMIALPLLIFFADIIGIYGGLLVAKMQLDITPAQFIERLHNEVDVRHYLVGLFKAPFFALIIASIGCFRGFQVSGNTESIGRYTTMSVVNSIFLVIAMDALFSVIFTELDI